MAACFCEKVNLEYISDEFKAPKELSAAGTATAVGMSQQKCAKQQA
jgi:hypothetical protein